MIGLVWNGMMSFGGGWFFLVASEAITYCRPPRLRTPGIGAYVAAALAKGSVGDICIAIGVMVVMVVGVNFVFWRPLVAWSEKFRMRPLGGRATPQRRCSPSSAARHPGRYVGRHCLSSAASIQFTGRSAWRSTRS